MRRIGIVGARDFARLDLVDSFVRALPSGTVVISGGAKGVDSAARESAERYGLRVVEHLPNLEGCNSKHELTKAYYERNQRIVDDADEIAAFTDKDTGGTWDTIRRARAAEKHVKIITSTTDTQITKETEYDFGFNFDFSLDPPRKIERKTQDIYHMAAVGLGSYALNRRMQKTDGFLKEFVHLKDTDPGKLADIMLPDFVQFFRKYAHGHIDALTAAQRSQRNINKAHPVDILCEKLAVELSIPYIRLLKPWAKPGRGVRDYVADVYLEPDAANCKAGVVYVLDDVITTGHSLAAGVKALCKAGIHAHGVAYISWSGSGSGSGSGGGKKEL